MFPTTPVMQNSSEVEIRNTPKSPPQLTNLFSSIMAELLISVFKPPTLFINLKKAMFCSSEEEVESLLVSGRMVKATYGRKLEYRLVGFEKSKNLESAFPFANFKNYKEYFEKRYGVVIKNLNQKLVIGVPINNSDCSTTLLVPELLIDLGTMICAKSIENSKPKICVSEEGLAHSSKKLQNLLKDAQAQYEEYYGGLSDNELPPIGNLLLTTPFIQMGKISFHPDEYFAQKLPFRQFELTGMADWVLVIGDSSEVTTPEVRDSKIKEILTSFEKVSNSIKVSYEAPKKIVTVDSFKSGEEVISKIEEQLGSFKPKIILFLFDFVDSGKIYRKCKTHFGAAGVPTQFWATSQKLTSNFSVYMSLLTQMLAKMGRSAWTVENPLEPLNREVTCVLGVNAFWDEGSLIVSICGTGGSKFHQTYSNFTRLSAEKVSKMKNELLSKKAASETSNEASKFVINQKNWKEFLEAKVLSELMVKDGENFGGEIKFPEQFVVFLSGNAGILEIIPTNNKDRKNRDFSDSKNTLSPKASFEEKPSQDVSGKEESPNESPKKDDSPSSPKISSSSSSSLRAEHPLSDPIRFLKSLLRSKKPYSPLLTFISVSRTFDAEFSRMTTYKHQNFNFGSALMPPHIEKANFDFYIITKSIDNKGMVPIHYIVRPNETEMQIEIVYLAFALMFTYLNTRGITQLDGLTLNAIKQRYMAHNLDKPVAENLHSTPYYL